MQTPNHAISADSEKWLAFERRNDSELGSLRSSDGQMRAHKSFNTDAQVRLCVGQV